MARRLSIDSVLVEFLGLQHFQFHAKGNADSWGAARYGALLFFPDQRIELIDLTDAAQIDQAAAEFLLAIRDLQKAPHAEGQALHEKIFAPIARLRCGRSRGRR